MTNDKYHETSHNQPLPVRGCLGTRLPLKKTFVHPSSMILLASVDCVILRNIRHLSLRHCFHTLCPLTYFTNASAFEDMNIYLTINLLILIN